MEEYLASISLRCVSFLSHLVISSSLDLLGSSMRLTTEEFSPRPVAMLIMTTCGPCPFFLPWFGTVHKRVIVLSSGTPMGTSCRARWRVPSVDRGSYSSFDVRMVSWVSNRSEACELVGTSKCFLFGTD